MDSAEPFESRIPTADGTELFCLKQVPQDPKGILVLVHGVAEHCGRYGYTADFFCQSGFAVYRFDLRGHGRSGGSRGHFRDFLDPVRDTVRIVEHAHSEHPDLPIFMLGHSMGGFIAAAFGILYPELLRGQILSGAALTELPLPDIRLLKKLPYRLLGRLAAGNKLGALVSRDPSVVEAYASDPLNLRRTSLRLNGEMFIKGAAWMRQNADRYALPCLLLHGGDDRIVTPDSSAWFYGSIASKDKDRKVYPGLYHEIFNEKERDAVLADIHDWLYNRLSSDGTAKGEAQ